jgi:hypothetical protein
MFFADFCKNEVFLLEKEKPLKALWIKALRGFLISVSANGEKMCRQDEYWLPCFPSNSLSQTYLFPIIFNL